MAAGVRTPTVHPGDEAVAVPHQAADPGAGQELLWKTLVGAAPPGHVVRPTPPRPAIPRGKLQSTEAKPTDMYTQSQRQKG